jgi:SH3-like domain-containing protein
MLTPTGMAYRKYYSDVPSAAVRTGLFPYDSDLRAPQRLVGVASKWEPQTTGYFAIMFLLGPPTRKTESLTLYCSHPVKPEVRSLFLCVIPWLFAACLFFSGCNRSRGRVLEIEYVAVPQAVLRDHVAAVFNKTGMVKNGERVEVIDRERRFVKVRASGGEEGWIEQRFLASEQVYQEFRKLEQQEKDDPIEASGTTRNETNLHGTPGRETEHLYLLNEGSKVLILKRATVEKTVPGVSAKPANQTGKATDAPMEDWWLIRDGQGRVGWLLARMVDLDVPLEIAQYAEGQRLVAFFPLNQVADGDKKVSQYLVLFTEPKDGLPFDYNQIRVFTWNVRRHRYETAYRERNLDGVLPVTVSQENFDKEGVLPVFVLRVKDDAGKIVERKYKLNTPMVHRVLGPGEVKETAQSKRRGHR